MKAVVVFLCLFVGVVYSGTPWQFCKGFSASSKVGVTIVDVPGCSAPPCTLKRGSTATVNITFKANADIKDVVNHLYGHIAGINVPFPGFPDNETDACKLLIGGTHCPFVKSSAYDEVVVFPVSSSFPAITTTAVWKLEDDSGTEVGCFELPVKLE